VAASKVEWMAREQRQPHRVGVVGELAFSAIKGFGKSSNSESLRRLFAEALAA